MGSGDDYGGWADRTGAYSPAYYAEIGPNEVSETLATALAYYAHDDAAILEIGCGSGRHLDRLLDAGFSNLTGIDVNDDSFAVMAEHYPRLADRGTFHTGAIEDRLPEYEDDAFDVVFSVETLQHVPPENAWVFEEVARAAADVLITAENEGNGPQRGRSDGEVTYVDDDFPLYFRNWQDVFGDLGLAQLTSERTARDTVRVFRVG